MITTTRFPYWIERTADGSYRARFPSIPEILPTAPSIAKLVEGLQDEVLPALEARLKEDRLPEPREPRAGEEVFSLSPNFASKLHLIVALKKEKLSGSELARRLGCLPQETHRLLKLSHPTKIDTISAALSALVANSPVRSPSDIDWSKAKAAASALKSDRSNRNNKGAPRGRRALSR